MLDQNSELGIRIVPDVIHRPNVWGKIYLGLCAVAIARIPEAFNDALSIRDYLPEPLDAPDHVGNIAAMGFCVFPFINGYMQAEHETVATHDNYRRSNRRTAMIVGGLTVAANVAGEVVGYGKLSTADPIDFCYGLLGGYIYWKARKPKFISETSLDEIIKLATNKEYEQITDDADPQRIARITEVVRGYKEKITLVKVTKAKLNERPRQVNTLPVRRLRTDKGIHQGRYTPPKRKR